LGMKSNYAFWSRNTTSKNKGQGTTQIVEEHLKKVKYREKKKLGYQSSSGREISERKVKEGFSVVVGSRADGSFERNRKREG